ncbi:VOC family protein [Ruixingdingia sedimenti]|uniref:VOC family protein n=1 Tax=Ruixingdingia sedimenti TaxID=3073604 RepID=A0ABU1F2W4_9RHOB|nr:VOC family protein [Xinfangfangia sp. LG-4]MDR5651206.1 VOC family protein [Xinfangfangia sp. LG-4]
MADTLEAPRLTGPKNPGLTPTMLNHAAWVTHDVAATYDFYTRIMGMEIASTVIDDKVPSTGDDFPYFHIFFKMQDGSTFAFFESPGLPPPAKSTHPAYDVFNHIALEVSSPAEVMKWHEWLTSNGLDVVGPTDHKGIILSIYFHDPNGVRLEITTPLDKDWNNHTEHAKEDFRMWVEAKEKAKAEGRDLVQAMIQLAQDVRKRYEH